MPVCIENGLGFGFVGAATGKYISFLFQLPVCNARPIDIYIIRVPMRNRNNEFIL